MKEVNFEKYKSGLVKMFGEETTAALIESLGGEYKIKDASFATTEDTHAAFKGSFVYNILELTKMAVKLNKLYPENMQVPIESLTKVCLLSQIAKVVMFKENTNEWEVNKLGKVFTYTTLDGALRCGERSILIAMNAGVKFTPIEYEAMRILDKSNDNDAYSKYYSSVLATIIKQANEAITLINKEN